MPIKRLSDAQLVLKAKRSTKMKERAKELQNEASRLDGVVMKELERRHTRVLEHNGTKITRVQTERVTINSEELLATLTPAQRKLCEKKVFDRQGLEAAVQAGIIAIEKVTPHSETTLNNPYLVVTAVALMP